MNEFIYCWFISNEGGHSSVSSIIKEILDVLYFTYPHSFDLELLIKVEFIEKGGDLKTIKILQLTFSPDISREDIKNALILAFAPFKFYFKDAVITKVIIYGPPVAL